MKEVELEVQAAKATETPTMVETGDGVVDSNEPEELQCEVSLRLKLMSRRLLVFFGSLCLTV